jgi:hypothetical protein
MSETFFRFFELPEELRYIIIKNMTVLSRINFIIALNGSLNIKASKEDWDNANSDITSESERDSDSDCDDIDSSISESDSDSY